MLTQSPIGLILANVLDIGPASVEDAVGLIKEIVIGIHDKIEHKENKKLEYCLVSNDYLNQVRFFRDVVSGNFELTPRSRFYPVQPHSIFSKDYASIKLVGQSTFHFYVMFFLVTGETYKVYITPLPGTSEVNGILPIPLKKCQIKFELLVPETLPKEQYCRLSFELVK